MYGFDTALYSFFWKFQNPMTIGLAEICQRMGDKTAYIICLVVALILCVPKVTRKYESSAGRVGSAKLRGNPLKD